MLLKVADSAGMLAEIVSAANLDVFNYGRIAKWIGRDYSSILAYHVG